MCTAWCKHVLCPTSNLNLFVSAGMSKLELVIFFLSVQFDILLSYAYLRHFATCLTKLVNQMKRVDSHSYIQLLLIHWWMLYLSSPSLYTKLVNFVHLIKLLIFSWLNNTSPSLSPIFIIPELFFVRSLSYFVVQLGVQWGCWKSSFRSI